MTTYLVTGCTGYIGKHLIQTLREEPGAEIFGISQHPDPQAEGWHSLEADLLAPNLSDLIAVLAPDVIFHLAAAPRETSIETQLNINVHGTQRLLEALVQHNLTPRVVVVGSAAEYGPQSAAISEESPLKPVSDYGTAKGAQTQVALQYAKQHQLPLMVARIFNVYGETPASLVMGSLASRIAELEQEHPLHPTLRIRNLESTRDFIHLQDVLSALRLLASQGHPGEIYNIGAGQAVTIRSVVESFESVSTLKDLTLEPEGTPTDDHSQAVIQKIQSHVGWEPTVPLATGIEQELAYWRTQVLERVPLKTV